MKRVFLDSNVILDSILQREGYEVVNQILQMGKYLYFKNCTSVLSFANIAYILRKYIPNKEDLHNTMTSLFKCLSILPMSDLQVFDSLKRWGPDFEDALQMACADYGSCDLVITRDKKHFQGFTLPVYTPEEFFRAVTED